jgi:hypothetical protein
MRANLCDGLGAFRRGTPRLEAMNLARHAAVLWRFRRVSAVGILLGIFLAIFASYRIGPGGLTPRGSETWTAVSSVWVTQPGFPEGRVVLPTQQVDGAVTTDDQPAEGDNPRPDDEVAFADPGRLAYLGDLYAKLTGSDEILSRVKSHPSPAQVQASPFAASQSGQLLPVVQLTTMAATAKSAHALNVEVFEALRDYVNDGQRRNDVGQGKRIELKMIQQPAVALSSGHKPTGSILVFMLAMLGTVAVAHLLEALRSRRQAATLASLDEWDPPEGAPLEPFQPNGSASHRGAPERSLR